MRLRRGPPKEPDSTQPVPGLAKAMPLAEAQRRFFFREIGPENDQHRRILPINSGLLIVRGPGWEEEHKDILREAERRRTVPFYANDEDDDRDRCVYIDPKKIERLLRSTSPELIAKRIETEIERLKRDPDRRHVLRDPQTEALIRSCRHILEVPHEWISRVHAVVRPNDNGGLELYPLGVNRIRIAGAHHNEVAELGENVKLSDEDRITWADRSALRSLEYSRGIKVYASPKYVKGFIVACDSHERHEDIFVNAVMDVGVAITGANGHQYNKYLIGSDATPSSVRNALADFKTEDPDALLVIVVYAHGHEQVISLHDHKKLSKREFNGLLAEIPCKKIVIVNSCHAGGVWGDEKVPRTTFVLSSRSDQLTYGGRFLEDVAAFIRRNISAGTPADVKGLSIEYTNQNPVVPIDSPTGFVG